MTPAQYRRTIGWLDSRALRARCTQPPDEVKRLAGLAACRPFLSAAERNAAATDLAALAGTIAADPAADATDPVLLVEALDALGAAHGAGARAYLTELAARIGAAGGETAAHPRFLRLRDAFARTGGLAAPSADDWRASDMPTPDALLAGDAALVTRACDRIAGLLAHGVRADDETLAVLVAIAVSECRRYNLVLAATVFRVLRLAAATDRATRSVEAFLERQSSRHGYFGHPSPFVTERREHDPVRVQLPITVAVACAFAAPPQEALAASC